MSTMTLRERTLAALNHETPDQVPAHHMGIQRWKDYMESVGIESDKGEEGNWLQVFRELDEFWRIGVRRYSFTWKGPQMKDEDGKPLQLWGTPPEPTYTCLLYRPLAEAETAADVDAHDWPDPADCDWEPMREGLKKETTRVRTGPCWDPLFSRLCDLFGMEQAMINLYVNPVVIEAALAHLDDFYTVYYKDQIEVCGEYLDIFGLGDDFATQRKLMIRTEDWRKYFLPLYRKYLAMGRAAGLTTWMHSCGAVGEILPDLVDSGLEVWETVQAHLPGSEPERLKRDFGHHLAFVGGINCQHVLGRGTPDKVREHVRERIRVLGRGGGYICGPDHTMLHEVPFENITAMYEEIRAFRGEGCTL